MILKNLALTTILLSTLSCSDFIKLTDSQYGNEIALDEGEKFSVVFSNNINGETHPCGWRKFPLGGLPQVYGQLNSLREKHPLIYVDSGDTLFETPIIAEYNQKSAEFKARKIAEALDDLGLRIFTPGDQDFAMGVEFLAEISQKHKFQFLMTNAKDNLKIKHEKKIKIKVGSKNFIFLGVIEPSLLLPKFRSYFLDPKQVLTEELKNLKKDDYLIIMSHAGMDYDISLANNSDKIDWILGSHTQSFTTAPREVNQTKIAQVLSRNHYLGEVKFFDEKNYELLEIRDETKDLVKSNPMVTWLDKFKAELDQIYLAEQSVFTTHIKEDNRIPTYLSCSECHTQQVEFWQKTAHSISYSTLIHAKESNNPNCVKCHSVGMNQPEGFSNKSNMIVSEKEDFDDEKYWEELGAKVKFQHPVRKLSGEDRMEISAKWIELDKSKGITHNFANVQCSNCHVQDGEHPFSEKATQTPLELQNKCLSCHSRDQSPEWYNKDEKGLATTLNEKYFATQLKKVACPLEN